VVTQIFAARKTGTVLRLMAGLLAGREMNGLSWPDPLCTGAYRLEIISAMLVDFKNLRD